MFDELLSIEFETLNAKDARDVFVRLNKGRAAFDAALVRCARRIEDTNAHVGTGHRNASSFVASTSGVSPAERSPC